MHIKREKKKKHRVLIGTCAGSAKLMDTLLAIQKPSRDRTGLGFTSSSSLTPQIGPMFVMEYSLQ